MGRKKQPEPDDKEQSARFVETAKQIKVDKDKEVFEGVCKKIVKKKPTPANASKDAS